MSVSKFSARALCDAFCAFGLLLGMTPAAQATITVLAQYKLGEADASAAPGAPVGATSLPSVGTSALNRVGAPTYSNATTSAPRPSPLSVAFNGTSDGLRASALLTNVNDNFGVEAWVRPTNAVGNSTIAYNGNTSPNGWGLFRSGTSFGYLYGGNLLALYPNTVNLNQWTHLAVVRNVGVTTFYINGVAQSPIYPHFPNPPTSGTFSIGINPLSPGEYFAGNIDEVRVFTFTAGQFAVSDLQFASSYAESIPTLSSFSIFAMLLALGALGVFSVRAFARRR